MRASGTEDRGSAPSRVGAASRAFTTSLPPVVTRRSTWVVAGVLVVVLVAFAAWCRVRVIDATRELLARDLSTLLNAEVEALEAWIAGEEASALAAAHDPVVVSAVGQIASELRGAAPDPREVAHWRADLGEQLAPVLEARGYVGYLIVGPGDVVLASSRPEEEDHPLGASYPTEVRKQLASEVQFVPPFMWATGDRSEPAMLVGAPLRPLVGVPKAMLYFRLDPAAAFTRILRVGRGGRSGETYAFDRAGVLLSSSRFDEMLRRAGLLGPGQESILHMRLADPGVDLVRAGVSARPDATRRLTHMEAEAVRGGEGVDVTGYRDYRGVPVVGAWRWLEGRGFGVATEVDRDEAYGPILALRPVFAALFATAVLLGALGLVLALLMQRQRVRLAHAAAAVKKLGQYHLEERIGEGGMGAVYKATHAMLKRPTAVKVLPPETSADPVAMARFEREVQHTAQLTHPNTVHVYDYGQTDGGRFYYAMELVDGVNLRDIVRTTGPLPPARAVHILAGAAASLAEAHRLGWVHRDVKPSNIMLCRRRGLQDVVKVLDFGLAKSVGLAETGITRRGGVVGTPRYISPEVARGEEADARSDIYGLGAVAFYLLTGRAVFEGADADELLAKHARDVPPALSAVASQHIPEPLERLVLRCLAKTREGRPADAGVLLDALEALEMDAGWTRRDAERWWREHEADFPATPSVRGSQGRLLTVSIEAPASRRRRGLG